MPSPLLLLALAASQPTGAIGYLNAGELLERCTATSAPDLSYCFAYVTGVHDSVKAYEAWLAMQEYCLPLATPQGDLRRAFIEYMAGHPGDRAGEAASVVIVALKARYGCEADAHPEP